MPSLLDVQRAMQRFIASGEPAELADLVVSDRVAGTDRLRVYRNTHYAVLVEALRLSFPAVCRLVGDEFFEEGARVFATEHPPTSAYLNDYGAEFADFITGFSPAAGLPYLPDVARLEFAVSLAANAQDAAPLNIAELSCLPKDCHENLIFHPHPSLRLLALGHPADAIWRAVLEGDEAGLSAIDPSGPSVRLIVWRGLGGVEVARMEEAAWRFTSALCSGQTFGAALQTAAEQDLPQILAVHLTNDRFAGFEITRTATEDAS